MTESTIINYTHKSSIDLILTNRKQNFMLSEAVETGLSDRHKVVTAFMHNTYSRQEPIKIFYHNYSNFDKTKFIEDLKNRLTTLQNQKMMLIVNITFYLPLYKKCKTNMLLKKQGHQRKPRPFMNKALSKAIMTSQLKTKYNNTKQEADRNAYKKQRNLCVKLRRKAVKQYFVDKCRSRIMSNKNFWETVKPFISNKTNRNESDIILIESNNIIKDRKNVSNTLNEHFINIAEYTVGRQITALPSQDIHF